MEAGVAATIGALVALFAATGTYLRFRRKESGDVDTTDADKLWEVLMARLDTVEDAERKCQEALAATNVRLAVVENQLNGG